MPACAFLNHITRRPLAILSGLAILLLAATFFLPRGPAVAGAPGSQDVDPAPVLPPLHETINESLGLIHSDLVNIHLDAAPGQGFVTVLTLDGEPYTLQAWPHSVTGANFRVRMQIDDGSLVDFDPGPERTIRGRLLEIPGSKVAGSLLDDGLHAMILFDDGSRLWVEPASPHAPAGEPVDASLHVVYATDDTLDIGGTCGVTDQPIGRGAVQDLSLQGEGAFIASQHDEAAGSGGEGGVGGSSIECVNIAIDADFQYYQKFNNSMNSVLNQITLIVNTGNLQYESDVQIRHVITEIIVRTSSSANPYTTNSAGELLSQFRSTWNTSPEWSISRNVAHLWTGRNLNGSTIGIAYLARVCQKTWAYGLSQHLNSSLSWRTDLYAHEVGHNWSALHCSCPNHTMNSSLTGANTFHPTHTIPTINQYKNSSSGWCTTSCDPDEDPGEPDPPSHPHNTCPSALNVGAGATEFNNFEATTTGFEEAICGFAGETSIESDVWFRHTATCTGELTISLCDSEPSFDTKMAVYGASCPAVPDSALACNKDTCGVHSAITIPVVSGQIVRIRVGGHQGAEGVGVLLIECNIPGQEPACPADLTGSGDVTVFDLLELLAAWGSCGGCDADLTGSGDVNVFDLLELLSAWGNCPQ